MVILQCFETGWWCMHFTLALGSQISGFKDGQDYTEKPCVAKMKINKVKCLKNYVSESSYSRTKQQQKTVYVLCRQNSMSSQVFFSVTFHFI